MSAPSILIVDDEQTLANNYKKLFIQEDWPAEAVYGGKVALAKIQERAYDVVLLDMRLPKENDGFAVLEGILKIRPQTCVVFFTAYGDVNSAVKALGMGAKSMVLKGPPFEQIFAVVRAAWLECQKSEKLRLENEEYRRREESRKIKDACKEAMQTLSQGVAHQMRNGLLDCGWQLSKIERINQNSEVKLATERIRESFATMEIYIDQLYEFWRIEADPNLEMETVSIKSAVQEGYEIARRHMSQHPRAVRLHQDVSDSLRAVCVRGMLPQVFEILFHNAMQAIQGEGGEIDVTAKDEGEFAVTTVSDNGPGFSAAMLDRAHLPFVTSKKGQGQSGPAENFGLGLAFVKVVVERSGGKLRYDNQPTRGAVVEFTLPHSK